MRGGCRQRIAVEFHVAWCEGAPVWGCSRRYLSVLRAYSANELLFVKLDGPANKRTSIRVQDADGLGASAILRDARPSPDADGTLSEVS